MSAMVLQSIHFQNWIWSSDLKLLTDVSGKEGFINWSVFPSIWTATKLSSCSPSGWILAVFGCSAVLNDVDSPDAKLKVEIVALENVAF